MADGLLNKASIILTPTGYKAGTLYNVAPIEAPYEDFDFARTSTATRINSSGLVSNVATGVPRISYDSNGDNGHILLEPTSTNLVPYSEDFSQSLWNKTRCEITANQAISPDGTLNADLMTATDDDARLEDVVASSGIIVTQSIYVKSATGGNVSGQIDFAGLDVVSFTANNDWQRVETTLSDTSISPRLRIRITNDGDSLYVWGGQVEALGYATSYIPTLTGSTETRATETATGAGSATLINSTEGVLYAEIAALVEVDAQRRFITLNDGTSSNGVVIRYESTGVINARYQISGIAQASISHTTTITNTRKIAFKYKQNDFALWVDGVEVGTDNSGSVLGANTINNIDFHSGNGAFSFYGKCKALAVFNEALSDSELTQLTT